MAYKTINGKRTLPLNSIRCNDLAFHLFTGVGILDSDLSVVADREFTEGREFKCSASKIKFLSRFDGENQKYADSFSGKIKIKVEMVDPTYGIHISVEQL